MPVKINGLGFCLVLVGMTIAGTVEVAADHAGADLATKANNPVASANQLQLQNLYIPDSNNAGGDANTFIIQPVLSFNLPEGGYFESLVTRFTIPYVSTPDIGAFDLSETDWGDTLAIAALTHTTPGAAEGEFQTWAPVAAVSIPTSGSSLTGSDDWKAGPGLLYLENKKLSKNSLLFGVLGYHLWDINGDVDSSVTSVQPIITYKFDSLFGQDGWYVRPPDDNWNYDWEANEFIQIPIGPTIGRAFVIGKQPVNIYLTGWWNAVSPDDATTPEWAIKAGLSLIFPK